MEKETREDVTENSFESNTYAQRDRTKETRGERDASEKKLFSKIFTAYLLKRI